MEHVNGAILEAPPASEATVIIKIRKPPPIEVEIDVSKVTWGDVFEFETLLAKDNTKETNERLIDFLQKCIPDIDVRTLPASTMTPIIEAVMGEIQSIGAGERRKN
jgi:hypothetical protein